MTSHRADRDTRTVALTELADPPALPSVPASRNTRLRRRAVSLAAGAVAFAGMFSVIHDNLLDHPTPVRLPAPAHTSPRQPVPPALVITPAAQAAAVETTATPEQPPAQAAPARQPAAPKPAPAKQTGFQQWIPQPALSMINQWWPR
jgi:hypothetical protein